VQIWSSIIFVSRIRISIYSSSRRQNSIFSDLPSVFWNKQNFIDNNKLNGLILIGHTNKRMIASKHYAHVESMIPLVGLLGAWFVLGLSWLQTTVTDGYVMISVEISRGDGTSCADWLQRLFFNWSNDLNCAENMELWNDLSSWRVDELAAIDKVYLGEVWVRINKLTCLWLLRLAVVGPCHHLVRCVTSLSDVRWCRCILQLWRQQRV